MQQSKDEQTFYAEKATYLAALDAAEISVESVQEIVESKVTFDSRTGLDIKVVAKAVATSVVAYLEGLRTYEYPDRSYTHYGRHYDWRTLTHYVRSEDHQSLDIGYYQPKNRTKASFLFTRSGRVSVQRYDLMAGDTLSVVETFSVEARQPVALPDKLARDLIQTLAIKVRLLPFWVYPSDLQASKITFCRPEEGKRIARDPALVRADRRSHILANLSRTSWAVRQHRFAESPEDPLDKAEHHLRLYKGPEAAEALQWTKKIREMYAKTEAEIARLVGVVEESIQSLDTFVRKMK